MLFSKKSENGDILIAHMCQFVAAHKFHMLTKDNPIPPFLCREELKIAEAWTNGIRRKGLIPEMYRRIIKGAI